MRMFFIWLLTLATAVFSQAQALACGAETACNVGSRSYHVQTPQHWDGAQKLPVLLHLHGWGRQGRNVMRNTRITGPADRHGLLLIAPDGIRKSWGFNGDGVRDTEFLQRVIRDAARRWPIDLGRIYVSGFSYGGAMAWRLACNLGDQFAGYLPIAGGLWRQSDVECAGPVRLAHVHGLDDTVYGLPVSAWDDTEDGVLLWRRMNGTPGAPDRRFDHARYDCRVWGADQELTLCTHPGGHFIPKDWLDWALARMLSVQTE